ncbi:MAG: flagellar biosynthetic protein FliR [Actinomycetota bacterium]|nr:flagellar biosynthetic protein FliR [Actinomycetota bacterium]
MSTAAQAVSALPFGLSEATVSAFLLVLARTSSWVIAAPVLSAKGVAGPGRLALAVALALFVTPLVPASEVPTEAPAYIAAVLAQIAVGLVLGLLTQLLFAAFEVAGTLADLSGGFSFASILDPLTGQPAAAFSRLFTICFTAIFFATDVYAAVLGGFVRSFDVLPLEALPALSDATPAALGSAVTLVLASALQIAAPLLGVLFLTDVALGLATRFAPQANALSLALPVKTMVALLAAGATLALLPTHLFELVEPAVGLPYEVLR